ncbi:MAG TPA: response regulator [Bacteroidia bacterium]|jgi:DNA-binding NarL/FixJ family response regulator
MANSRIITVFLVDDNALYLKNLEISFMSKPYYNVETFPTGERCIAALSHNPDIIILDYHLNEVVPEAKNGLETLIEIRKVNPTVPIVVLSADESPDVANNCMEHEAVEFIIKDDISFAKLREVITNVFLDKQEKENLISHLKRVINNSAR